MSLAIEQQVNLKPYNTLALPARAEHFVAVAAVEQLQQAIEVANGSGWPITLLGGGSNVVLAGDLPGLVVRIALPGIELLGGDSGRVLVKVGAGENWHQLVLYCLQQGWYGLENLALIPGTVGAAPVQNIGAYGVELADRLHSVEVVDLASGELRTLSADDCQFGYRDSIFKGALRGAVAIVSVTLSLLTAPQLKLEYPSLRQGLEGLPDAELTPRRVAELICQIRASKLPNPAVIANAGSFFKNPLVSTARARQLQQRFPEMVVFTAAPGQMKLAAGWLIEHAGWKGRRVGAIGIHDRQALVLVNYGDGDGQQLLAVAAQVVASVQAKFGVTLEMEPPVLPTADAC